jgi:hypothetical protein
MDQDHRGALKSREQEILDTPSGRLYAMASPVQPGELTFSSGDRLLRQPGGLEGFGVIPEVLVTTDSALANR